MIVVDASCIVELLLGTPVASPVASRIESAGLVLHAPHLLDVEVVQVLRRFVRSGEIPAERAAATLHVLVAMKIHRHAHVNLLDRLLRLRDQLSAYDAVYVALAESLDAPLITCDRKLAASRGHAATIELI